MTNAQYRGGRSIAVLLVAILILGFALTMMKRRVGVDIWMPRSSAAWTIIHFASEVVERTQLSLASLWLAWGTRHLAVRCIVFVSVGILHASQIILSIPQSVGYRFEISAFMFFVVAVTSAEVVSTLMALVLRVGGIRLERFTIDEVAGPTLPVSKTNFRDYKFSLMSMFKWTTIAAVMVGLLRLAIVYIRQDEEYAASLDQFSASPWIWILWTIAAVIPISMGWAVLTVRRVAPRLLVATVASAATVLGRYMVGVDLRWESMVFTCAFGCTMAAAFFVFRYAGYRLLWRAVRAEPALES